MRRFVSRIVLSSMTVAAVLSQDAMAQSTKMLDAEAKMFTASAGYERFMGRWSRQLAPLYVSFAGIKNGDRVLDVGTGTGSVAATVEAAMPASQIKGLEFDRVVLVEPADIVAAEPRGMSRLYVALTRAVAELVILHTKPLPATIVE